MTAMVIKVIGRNLAHSDHLSQEWVLCLAFVFFRTRPLRTEPKMLNDWPMMPVQRPMD